MPIGRCELQPIPTRDSKETGWIQPRTYQTVDFIAFFERVHFHNNERLASIIIKIDNNNKKNNNDLLTAYLQSTSTYVKTNLIYLQGQQERGLPRANLQSSYISLPVYPFPVNVLQFEAPTTSKATFRVLLTVSLILCSRPWPPSGLVQALNSRALRNSPTHNISFVHLIYCTIWNARSFLR